MMASKLQCDSCINMILEILNQSDTACKQLLQDGETSSQSPLQPSVSYPDPRDLKPHPPITGSAMMKGKIKACSHSSQSLQVKLLSQDNRLISKQNCFFAGELMGLPIYLPIVQGRLIDRRNGGCHKNMPVDLACC